MERRVVAGVKAPTSADVMTGVVEALRKVLGRRRDGRQMQVGCGDDRNDAFHQCGGATPRSGANCADGAACACPPLQSLPPMVDWPEDLRDVLGTTTGTGPWRQRIRRAQDLCRSMPMNCRRIAAADRAQRASARSRCHPSSLRYRASSRKRSGRDSWPMRTTGRAYHVVRRYRAHWPAWSARMRRS
jgi:hypothetical protein